MSLSFWITTCSGIGVMAMLLHADAGPTSAPAGDRALLDSVAKAQESGNFAEAEAALDKALATPDGAACTECQVAREILRRIRIDFSQTPDALLAKVRKDIPDVSADDLERWRGQGVLQHRMIDGQVCYFNREPANLYRFCAEAKERRDRNPSTTGPATAQSDFVLVDHLARLVEIGEASDSPAIFPVKHHVRYRLKVRDGHPAVKKGAVVRCWLPFPKEYQQQKGVKLLAAGPGEPVTAPNGAPHRTLHFERRIDDPAQPVEFFAEFEFTTSAYYPKLDPAKVKPYEADSKLVRENTSQRPPHIVFSPGIRTTVAEIVGDETNPLLKARRIFRWISENIRYCSEMEYSTIPNLSAKAFETRQGDCGVQGILFITMCRCAGVPARWQSGWETKPSGHNMHDWAEMYVEPWGWLPADPSYGLQQHPDPKVHEFYLGHLDPYRMIVNVDYARELYPPAQGFRSEPNDFQRGEIEIDGRILYFDDWDYTFEVRTEPPVQK